VLAVLCCLTLPASHPGSPVPLPMWPQSQAHSGRGWESPAHRDPSSGCWPTELSPAEHQAGGMAGGEGSPRPQPNTSTRAGRAAFQAN